VEWSADQILAAIAAAMKAGDMPAVAGLMRMLAVRDPASASAILAVIDTVQLTAAKPPAKDSL
jgi:hypothetical protein